MPGTATHMIILERVISKLKRKNPDIALIMEANKDAAYLGSVGPDMYYFAPDTSDGMKDGIYKLLEIYDEVIAPILDFHKTYIAPVKDFVDDATKPLDEAACGALGSLKRDGEDLANRINAAIETKLVHLFADSIELFNVFIPPIQKGEPVEKWFWCDMLHYKYTTDYVRNIVNKVPTRLTPSSEVRLAYAMGHLTHIAGDVMGHAYVNQIVGGPYRSNNRRHHIQENFMDVWTHHNYKQEELIGAKLHRGFTDGNRLDSNNGLLKELARGLNTPPSRLTDLFNHLSAAFRDTYGNKIHPKRITGEFLSGSDINIAYWLNLAFTKFGTDSMLPPLRAPHEDIIDEINKRVNDLLNDIGSPPSPPNTDSPNLCLSFWNDDCNFSWKAVEDFFNSVLEAVKYIGKCIVWAITELIELIVNFVELVHCTIMETAVLPIKALLWVCSSLVNELHQSFRDAIVIAGYGFPTVDYLNSSPLGRQFTTAPGMWDAFNNYPHQQSSPPNANYIGYPMTPAEQLKTLGGPYIQGATPRAFIENVHMDVSLLSEYSQANSEQQTVAAERKRRPMGNAVDYAVELITQTYDSWKKGKTLPLFPNWNLDSDKGYGFKMYL